MLSATISSMGVYTILLSCHSNVDNSAILNSNSFKIVPSPMGVQISVIREVEIQEQITSRGRMIPKFDFNIVSNVNGTIEEVNFENGDTIERGQIIAKLSNSKIQYDLEIAKLNLINAEINYLSETVGNNDSERDSIIRLTSGYIEAQTYLELAKINYNSLQLRSPISGVVSSINYRRGDNIEIGEIFCRIFSSKEITIEVLLPEFYFPKIHKGYLCKILPLSLSDLEIPGEIESIDPSIDRESGLFKVTVLINGNSEIIPGMSCRVKINIPHGKGIMVPRRSVIEDRGNNVIFTVKNGLAKWHNVTTGIETEDEIQVISGIVSGDSVIISNNNFLSHNQKVRIENTE